ncbi:MAG: ATP-binding protein [Methanospirillum sp.]|nr:ATP-binding protein [Methanospirillum sp.]
MAKYSELTINSALMISITIFCIVVIITMTFVSYTETDRNLKSIYKKEQLSAEDLFNKSSIYIHRAYKLWDRTYNPPMEMSMQVVSGAYNRSGGDPASMNLSGIQQAIRSLTGFSMNIYLIDKDGIITKTTDEPQQGLDFSRYPEFFSRLNDIRNKTAFVPDEIVTGFVKGSPHKKFAYQPTGDHRYVIELGIDVEDELRNNRNALSYEDLVMHVMKEYPSINRIHMINSLFVPDIGKEDYQNETLDPFTRATVSWVFDHKSRVEIADPDNHTLTTYFYIPHNIDQSPASAYQDLIGKIIFDTRVGDEDIAHNLMVHLILGISGSLAAILVGWIVSRRLSTPINRIVDEIDLIACGDLNRDISPSSHPELNRIADAIRSMVQHIRSMIQDLEESESRYRSLFKSSSDAILIIDGEVIRDINPAAVSLLSGEQEIMPGVNINDICKPIGTIIGDEAGLCAKVTSVPSPENRVFARENELSTIVNGQLRHLNILYSPVFARSGTMIQVRIRDITASYNLQEEIKNRNIILENQIQERTQALQMTIEDLNAFTYTISHDLRAPLRRMYADMHHLKQHLPDISDFLLQFTRIHENLKFMDNLIRDLLQFSQMSRQPLIKNEINMNNLVAGIITEIHEGLTGPDIRFQVNDLKAAYGDYTLIRQALFNLISNAVKFSDANRLNEISMGSSLAGGEVLYVIKDTGIGFNNEYAGRIFDVFYRLHQTGEYEGTGVGLAIVKRIITRHGGWIEADSEEGKGTIIRFSLG